MSVCPIHFAPLQGYTDYVYRNVHAEIFGGIATYYTPFVRIEKGGFRKKDLHDIAIDVNRQVETVPQLIAATPEEFRQIASLFEREGYRRVDINLGCPFPMQIRQHRGAGILPYPDEAVALLRTVNEFPALSFSVKLRLGWECCDEALTLLPVLNDLPLTHVALHPRLGIMQYKGEVDMESFASFYESCSHPLFYNGNIETLEDISFITSRFPSLGGVMIGRGLLSNPWLAFEYQTGLTLSDEERKDRLRRFHSLLFQQYAQRMEGGEHQVLSKLKTLWDYLLPQAEKKKRKKVVKSTTLTAYLTAVDALLD